MKLSIGIDSWIRVNRDEAQAAGLLLPALRREFQHHNPDYQKKKRMGFWLGNTLRHMTLVFEANGEICFPRGGWARLSRQFEEAGVTLALTDATVTAPLSRPLGHSAPFALGEDQLEAAAACVTRRQGIVVGPCGSGKTEIALRAISDIGHRTLVLVHTERILKQWIATAEARFGKSRVGALYGKKKQWDRDVTIGMIQTIRNVLSKDRDFASQFGCVVLDEAHHAPATTFAQVVNAFPARWRLAFTATPKRKDGKEVLFYDAFGAELQMSRGSQVLRPTILYQIDDVDLDRKGRIMPVDVVVVPTDFEYDLNKEIALTAQGHCRNYDESAMAFAKRWATLNNYTGSLNTYAEMLDCMIRDGDRQARILEYLLPEVDAGHSCLMLADRREFCLEMQSWLLRKGIRTGRLMGGKNAAEQDKTQSALMSGALKVAVGTTVADEGLDISILARGFGCTPAAGNASRFVQQFGRLKRQHGKKSDAVYYYFWDRKIGSLRNHARAVLACVKAPHRVWYSERFGDRVPLTTKLLNQLEAI